MIIPFGDENIIGGHKPLVSYSFLVINILIFITQLTLGLDKYHASFDLFSLTPSSILQGQDLYTLFTHMFLHGGLLHLAGNMMFLWIFGDNIEATIGSFPFFLFYMASGLFAVAVHIFFDPVSNIPLVGASGAIAGVMGAYMIMFPKSKIKVLIVIFKKYIPAFIFLGIWLAMQIMNVLQPIEDGEISQVAWWAHIGGFVFGVIAGFIFKSIYPPNTNYKTTLV